MFTFEDAIAKYNENNPSMPIDMREFRESVQEIAAETLSEKEASVAINCEPITEDYDGRPQKANAPPTESNQIPVTVFQAAEQIQRDGISSEIEREAYITDLFGTVKNSTVHNFADAIKLQTTPGYTKNIGIIGVGYSDIHICAMLSDGRIRYIIPYLRIILPVFQRTSRLRRILAWPPITR